MLLATAMVAALFLLLGLFHCPCQVYDELLHHTLETIGIFAYSASLHVGAFFFQMCYSHCWGFGRLDAFQLLQREETHCLGFAWLISGLTAGWVNHLFLFSLPCHTKVVRLCLLISTGFQVSHHGLELFMESTIKMVTLQFGYMVWGEAFQK